MYATKLVLVLINGVTRGKYHKMSTVRVTSRITQGMRQEYDEISIKTGFLRLGLRHRIYFRISISLIRTKARFP